jgi:hypothetical protein
MRRTVIGAAVAHGRIIATKSQANSLVFLQEGQIKSLVLLDPVVQHS